MQIEVTVAELKLIKQGLSSAIDGGYSAEAEAPYRELYAKLNLVRDPQEIAQKLRTGLILCEAQLSLALSTGQIQMGAADVLLAANRILDETA